jgi:hypothetical protein
MIQGLSSKWGHRAKSALDVRTGVMEKSPGSQRWLDKYIGSCEANMPSERLRELSGLGLWALRLLFHMLSLPRNIVIYWDLWRHLRQIQCWDSCVQIPVVAGDKEECIRKWVASTRGERHIATVLNADVIEHWRDKMLWLSAFRQELRATRVHEEYHKIMTKEIDLWGVALQE